jgi:segregation and condensation protein A
LLYLIRKQNLDILNIPMLSITQQYLAYIEWMKHKKIELAADYLLMAAVLSEIKAKLMLPPDPSIEEEEEDPRMNLMRQLALYEQMKEAALWIDDLARQDRDHFVIQKQGIEPLGVQSEPEVSLQELVKIMHSLLRQEAHQATHHITREVLSVRERMSHILLQLQSQKHLIFQQLFLREEGRGGLIVSLLAILELAKQSLISISQEKAFATIHIEAV